MITLRCHCGKTFKVKPEQAGQVVTAPCCNAQVRVPAAKQAAAPERMQVKCPCGQVLAVAPSAGPVEVVCPACQQRLRLGGGATAPAPQPSADLFSGLPNTGPAPPMPSAPPRSRPAGGMAPRPRAKTASPKQRLPRLGALEDGFGVPLLICGGALFLGIFTALGVYLVGLASENMELAAASESWEPTDGTILASGVEARGAKRRAATISIRYEYQVGDSTYTGSNLSFEKQDSYTPSIAEAKLRPYPAGAKCTVYYDPQNPTQSVLIKGAQSSNQFYFWLGLASIVTGIVLAIDCAIGAVNAHRFPPKKVPLF